MCPFPLGSADTGTLHSTSVSYKASGGGRGGTSEGGENPITGHGFWLALGVLVLLIACKGFRPVMGDSLGRWRSPYIRISAGGVDDDDAADVVGGAIPRITAFVINDLPSSPSAAAGARACSDPALVCAVYSPRHYNWRVISALLFSDIALAVAILPYRTRTAVYPGRLRASPILYSRYILI